MKEKNELILKISNDDFNLILNSLKTNKNEHEYEILLKAKENYEEQKTQKKATLSLNKEIQIIKTKQKITKGISKIKQSGEEINAANISKYSGLSLPTIYKYKIFCKLVN